MPAAYTELEVDQGTDWSKVIYLSDDITGANANVTGYTVQCQLRRSLYSANAVNVSCTLTDAANGEITLSMNSYVTSELKAGPYFFDVKTINTADQADRVLEGLVFVSRQVSY